MIASMALTEVQAELTNLKPKWQEIQCPVLTPSPEITWGAYHPWFTRLGCNYSENSETDISISIHEDRHGEVSQERTWRRVECTARLRTCRRDCVEFQKPDQSAINWFVFHFAFNREVHHSDLNTPLRVKTNEVRNYRYLVNCRLNNDRHLSEQRSYDPCWVATVQPSHFSDIKKIHPRHVINFHTYSLSIPCKENSEIWHQMASQRPALQKPEERLIPKQTVRRSTASPVYISNRLQNDRCQEQAQHRTEDLKNQAHQR